MIMIKNNKIRILLAMLGLMTCAATIGGIYYYYTQTNSSKDIYNFNMERDSDDIHQVMKDNWYWLISSPDFSVDFMLKQKAPNNREPRYFGKLKIKVMRKNNSFVGFVAYYKKSFYEGQILFLVVDEKYRGKGFAQILLNYALNQLKKEGVSRARLVTRTSNLKAQALYKKEHFNEYARDDGYVYYEKSLN